MRFFTEIDGNIWECNSFGEYFETLFCTCLGKIIAWILILGAIAFAFLSFFT